MEHKTEAQLWASLERLEEEDENTNYLGNEEMSYAQWIENRDRIEKETQEVFAELKRRGVEI